jgi:hypothetical protein
MRISRIRLSCKHSPPQRTAHRAAPQGGYTSISEKRESHASDRTPEVRSGICTQAVLLASYRRILASMPLRSTVITRFPATMSLSDSRSEPACGYVFPQTVGGSPTTQPGLPGSSTNLSTRAVPYYPGKSDECTRPLLLRRWQASTNLADWPLPISVTRPKWVRLRYGSRVRHPSPRSPDYSRPRWLGYLLNGQFAE